MLSDHIQHLQVAFDNRDVMFEDLDKIKSTLELSAQSTHTRMALTSGHGICLAGAGPFPVRLLGLPLAPPPLTSPIVAYFGVSS